MIPVVWSEEEARHDPRAEIWVGVRTPATEIPARADAIRAALRAAGHPELPAREQPDDALLTVHGAGLVEFLRTAWEAWDATMPPIPAEAGVRLVYGKKDMP